MIEEFKVSETESYHFNRIDNSLVIAYNKERPKFADIERKRDVKSVEIVKSCIPEFKKYLDYIVKAITLYPIHLEKKSYECTSLDYTYIFKAHTEYVKERLQADVFEDLTIYQIPKGQFKDISHVTIDKIAISRLTRFIEENF